MRRKPPSPLPRARAPRIGCRTLAVALLCAACAFGTAGAGELIRYRRADGSIGFTGNLSELPPGAVVVAREPAGGEPAEDPPPSAPSIGELVSGVRGHCDARFAGDRREREYCITAQTRAAFALREILVTTPRNTEAARLHAGCRQRLERGRHPDYEQLLACVEVAEDAFERRTGVHPASLATPRAARGAEPERRRAPAPQPDRLRELRLEQQRAERELARGRNLWLPRVRSAEEDLARAEQRTAEIIDAMKDRGCRTDSLACGDLGPKLDAARRSEAEKREYLDDGIVNECRLAGCQPGWLR